MLATITDFKEKVTLIRDSGIQFLDFAFALPKKKEYGEFLLTEEDNPVIRLVYNERDENFLVPSASGSSAFAADSDYSLVLEKSLEIYNDIWLPLPFFRFNSSRSFAQGPTNWSRVKFHALDTPDEQGNTWRVTLAFDTKVSPDRRNTQYLEPVDDDVRSGVSFALAETHHEMGDFLLLKWVDDWLRETYTERATTLWRQYHEDTENCLNRKEHQAHYLNLINALNVLLQVPEIQLNDVKLQDNPINVDLVLDIGNSRSCGILIEEHRDGDQGLSNLYQLQLRDLSEPQYIYTDPFDSRLEFAQAEFGKQDFSVKSGRSDAFTWPTIGRVGEEAFRMASQRLGTEGSTGLSSPKRYLWDDAPYSPGWRFSRAFVKSDREPQATAPPMTYMINDKGEALYALKPSERMPVFTPEYSRSTLMTMMLSEVLAQALMQINSPAQRLKMRHASTPRQLKNIILTVPPAMPKPERAIFQKAMTQAIRLVWKALDWEDMDQGVDENGREDKNVSRKRTLPDVHVKWDEATCGQLVYLYNETQNYFGGRSEEFFAATVRPDNKREAGNDRTLKIASIDIGGGTTDLVITRYTLDEGNGSNVRIVPTQLFREGFKVAGDDILLDVIQLYLQPAFEAALLNIGYQDLDAEALMSRLFGSEALEAGKQVLRQQLTLQIFAPVALAILHRYEKFTPEAGEQVISATFNDLLSHQPTDKVCEYVDEEVKRSLPAGIENPFSILNVPLNINLMKLHNEFIDARHNRINICGSLRGLCEVLWHYNCDILLLTGRPSRLPGIQALIRHLQPVPPARVLPLHGYETGGWYPFNKKGLIDDPKSTAAVGAMLCLLAEKSRLSNFYFRTANFKPYSTIRYFGMLDSNNLLKDSNVFYRDIDLDTPGFQLDNQQYFESRGEMRLGFRQLDNERWSATPLYTLKIPGTRLATALSGDAVLRLKLEVEEGRGQEAETNGSPEKFRISEMDIVESTQNPRPQDVSFKLNTLVGSGLGETHYWLDSGSIKI
ncbi:putative virulence effector protein, SfrB [Xenorhabdus bovienii str. Jollieti]|uniref:Putative virulence effector protein n=1 Tax=Xenorhabdus bovienii (strain SS-2004) TaxID=406818 RepID=D3UZZ5_XENBS|nr:virulence factor SrfB [Xenorhabdus bovienii]CBJ80288.1 putative virulence effector protein [Xenorhabdus bovienii SS-2004]CDH29990.1 putative virulence effector protein, SfrB [Xenorhabdus bovienii str. Jollieti]